MSTIPNNFYALTNRFFKLVNEVAKNRLKTHGALPPSTDFTDWFNIAVNQYGLQRGETRPGFYGNAIQTAEVGKQQSDIQQNGLYFDSTNQKVVFVKYDSSGSGEVAEYPTATDQEKVSAFFSALLKYHTGVDLKPLSGKTENHFEVAANSLSDEVASEMLDIILEYADRGLFPIVNAAVAQPSAEMVTAMEQKYQQSAVSAAAPQKVAAFVVPKDVDQDYYQKIAQSLVDYYTEQINDAVDVMEAAVVSLDNNNTFQAKQQLLGFSPGQMNFDGSGDLVTNAAMPEPSGTFKKHNVGAAMEDLAREVAKAKKGYKFSDETVADSFEATLGKRSSQTVSELVQACTTSPYNQSAVTDASNAVLKAHGLSTDNKEFHDFVHHLATTDISSSLLSTLKMARAAGENVMGH